MVSQVTTALKSDASRLVFYGLFGVRFVEDAVDSNAANDMVELWLPEPAADMTRRRGAPGADLQRDMPAAAVLLPFRARLGDERQDFLLLLGHSKSAASLFR